MPKRALKTKAATADQRFAQRFIAALPMPAATVGRDMHVWASNQAWNALTGYEAGHRIYEDAFDRCSGAAVQTCEGARAAFQSLEDALGGGEGCSFGYPCVHEESECWSKLTVAPMDLPDDAALVLLEDVTHYHRQEGALANLAFRDPLTGLPNHRLFLEHAEQILSLAKRNSNGAAVVRLDVNDLRTINQHYGHEIGDALLRELAARLRGALRETDVLARIGGDDFAALLTAVAPDEVLAVLKRCHSELAAPYRLHGRTLRLSTSIGVALYPGHAADTKRLLDHAHAALGAAKASQSAIEVYRTPDASP